MQCITAGSLPVANNYELSGQGVAQAIVYLKPVFTADAVRQLERRPRY